LENKEILDGVYLSNLGYSYTEYTEAAWNLELLTYYPVNPYCLHFWSQVNEALFLYFYAEEDEGRLEKLLKQEVDETTIERLIIGYRILNALATPAPRNARLSFKKLAADIGLEINQLMDYIPCIPTYNDWSEIDSALPDYDVSDLFGYAKAQEEFLVTRSKDKRLIRFPRALNKSGLTELSYRPSDFRESEGLCFTKLFVYLLDIIAQRKRQRLRKYFLEYESHNDYVLGSFGLRKIVGKRGVSCIHDDLIDRNYKVDEIIALYHLEGEGIW
jgi:hypothetical protein